MKIILPPKKGAVDRKDREVEFDNLVVIGANGAGKTRFGSWLERENHKKVHRIAAQKSLNMPVSVKIEPVEKAKREFFCGTNSIHDQEWVTRLSWKWNRNPNTSLLNDFEKLMVLLCSEDADEAVYFTDFGGERPLTKLSRTKRIWEAVLTHRELLKRVGTIETCQVGQEDRKYSGSEMSDGERVIFYLAGSVICAQDSSIIIIDEPEMHIHPALQRRVFDLIEAERPDCSFIYLTHSIDFASSHKSAKKIWVKAYDGREWDYEILADKMPIPEQLYLEILGSRQPVIFTEGDISSLDHKVYEQLFPEFVVKPVGSCDKVTQLAKSFNNEVGFHRIKSYGIIDRDRRDESTVTNLVSQNICVLDVAEVENLLLLEDVVKAVAAHMDRKPADVFDHVKHNVVNFFKKEVDKQRGAYFKEELARRFLHLTDFKDMDVEEAIKEIDKRYHGIDKQAVFNEINRRFEEILKNGDYEGILRLFNQKGLIPNSDICHETGLNGPEEYKKLVVTLLKKNDETSTKMKEAMKDKIMGCRNIQ